MKLKSIMHALSYGKSRKALVRAEGARRVKQAEKKQSDLRNLQKLWSYCERYGSSSNLQQPLKESSDKKARSVSALHTFKVLYGDVL